MKTILFLTFFLFCPPPLTSFEMTRETNDGVTYSEGEIRRASRYIIPRYYDNRTEFDQVFWSRGVVTLGVGQQYWLGESRLVKYRWVVNAPYYGDYHVIKTDPWPNSNRHKEPYDVCYKDNEIVFYTDIVTNWSQPRTIQWDFEIYFEPTGDVNGDGVVNGEDIALVLSAWGTDSPQYDLNSDGIVNGNDLGLIFAAWN